MSKLRPKIPMMPSFSVRSSQRGSVMIQVMIAALLLSLLAANILNYFGRQASSHSSQRVIDELANLKNLVTMVLSNSTVCQTNLAGNLMGNSLNNLTPGNPVKIQFPAPSRLLLKPRGQYNQIQINNIFFSVPVQVNPPDASYLSEMTIEVEDAGGLPATRSITIPFYFVANGGNLTECLATTYPDPQPAGAKATLEDVLCREWEKVLKDKRLIPATMRDFIFAPVSKTCVEGP